MKYVTGGIRNLDLVIQDGQESLSKAGLQRRRFWRARACLAQVNCQLKLNCAL